MKKRKRYCVIACDEETHKTIKIAAAQKGKTIHGLLKETFGKTNEEDCKIGKKWPF